MTERAVRRSWFGRGLAWIARLEWAAILVLALVQLVPRPVRTAWPLLAIPVLWLVRWLAWGRITARTPLDVPLLVLALMAPVSLVATFDVQRSLEGVSSLILGVALAYALANSVRTKRLLRAAERTLLAIGAAIAATSLVVTHWPTTKVPGLTPLVGPLYERMPALWPSLQPRLAPLLGETVLAVQGVNANAVGGILVLFLPLAAALLLHRLRGPRRAAGWLCATIALAGGTALMAFALLLTQSRQAYVAGLVGLGVVVAFQGRWPRAGAIAGLAVCAGLVAYFGLANTAEAVFGIGDVVSPAASASWTGRVEIWNRALRILQDHPLTGIGFGAFFPVSHARYTMFLYPPGADLTHAHNIFLQVALDLGLPGLSAFLALLIAFGRMMARVWRRSTAPSHGALPLGLGCGLLAQVIFGLGDAMPLGHPVAILTWYVVGLGAAVWLQEARCQETKAVA